MTKQEFIAALQGLYRVGNAADGQDREDWTVPTMAGAACCRHLEPFGVRPSHGRRPFK